MVRELLMTLTSVSPVVQSCKQGRVSQRHLKFPTQATGSRMHTINQNWCVEEQNLERVLAQLYLRHLYCGRVDKQRKKMVNL